MSNDAQRHPAVQYGLFPNPLPPPGAQELTVVPALSPGKIFATQGAMAYMQRHGVQPGALLSRHVFADPGELSAEDIAANLHALRHRLRVLSVYAYGAERERIWLITEADRSATTILLPDEY